MLKQSRTPGGERLRALRQHAGKTQLVVELEADLGSGYLQRVESGKVAQPERKTLERILSALEANYRARAEVLDLFGYTAAKPLPTGREIAWACRACRPDLEAALMPAYLLDCGQRLLAWNRAVPPLLGLGPDDPEMQQLKYRCVIDGWYNPQSRLYALIAEPEQFLAQMMRALLHEMQPFRHEAWCRLLFKHWLSELPLFKEYWSKTMGDERSAIAARSTGYWGLKAPDGALLQFRLTVEYVRSDPRFRLLCFLPADAETIQRCALWARR